MNRIHVALSLTVSLFLAGSFPALAGQSQDVQAIREVLQTQQADAWNRHDAKAYAALFTQDGDVVNIVGWWWKGRDEIERKLDRKSVVEGKSVAVSVGQGCRSTIKIQKKTQI